MQPDYRWGLRRRRKDTHSSDAKQSTITFRRLSILFARARLHAAARPALERRFVQGCQLFDSIDRKPLLRIDRGDKQLLLIDQLLPHVVEAVAFMRNMVEAMRVKDLNARTIDFRLFQTAYFPDHVVLMKDIITVEAWHRTDRYQHACRRIQG